MALLEPKPVASLSAGLLARKGDAYPAMRRTYMPLTAVAPLPVSLQSDITRDEDDQLGWNDLGADVPPPPSSVPVIQQQARIARSFAAPAPTSVAKAAPRKLRAAFTLRLDAERHLRLRLASAVSNRSAQQIVTEALDAFLDQQPALDGLVTQARRAQPGSEA